MQFEHIVIMTKYVEQWSSEEIWNILPSPELQPWINCAQGQTNWNVMLPSCSKIFLSTFTNISAKQKV